MISRYTTVSILSADYVPFPSHLVLIAYTYLLTQMESEDATNGLAAAMAVRSQTASTSDIDLFIFGGPIDFTGYFPKWGDAAVASHEFFSWYSLK